MRVLIAQQLMQALMSLGEDSLAYDATGTAGLIRDDHHRDPQTIQIRDGAPSHRLKLQAGWMVDHTFLTGDRAIPIHEHNDIRHMVAPS